MKKAKTAAATFVCQSREETQTAITELGNAQRTLARLSSMINDQIAAITEANKGEIDALNARIDTLVTGIQGWCEANRDSLCGKGKSANLITGEVAWRQRPPSVSVRAAAKVIAALRSLRLDRFLREKTEINKEAILAEPQAVAGISGINVVTGVEDFIVTPFEMETTA